MKTIRRYDLQVEPVQTLEIPFNSEILDLGSFGDNPALWVLADLSQKIMMRTFTMVSEEKELAFRMNGTNYMGHFEHKGHVLHVFEAE